MKNSSRKVLLVTRTDDNDSVDRVASALEKRGKVREAEHKELQLRRAANAGLSVPRTLVTNDPVSAKDFFRN